MLRIDFGHHSAAADCPISVKFCVEKQFFYRNSATDKNTRVSCFPNVVWSSARAERVFVSSPIHLPD